MQFIVPDVIINVTTGICGTVLVIGIIQDPAYKGWPWGVVVCPYQHLIERTFFQAKDFIFICWYYSERISNKAQGILLYFQDQSLITNLANGCLTNENVKMLKLLITCWTFSWPLMCKSFGRRDRQLCQLLVNFFLTSGPNFEIVRKCLNQVDVPTWKLMLLCVILS